MRTCICTHRNSTELSSPELIMNPMLLWVAILVVIPRKINPENVGNNNQTD